MTAFVFAFDASDVATAQDVRTWTSRSGQFRVDASLISVEADSVRLRRADDGRMINVPITAVSTADQEYLQALKSQADKKPEAESISPPASPPNAWSMPEPSALRVEQESEGEFQLIPFGTISIPESGFAWRLAARQPIVFVGQRDREQEMLVLTIVPPAEDDSQRKARLKGAYSDAIHQVTAAGLTDLKGSKLETERSIADQTRFTISAADPTGDRRLFLTEVQFHERFTCIFQATAATSQRTAVLMKAAASFISFEDLRATAVTSKATE